MNTPCAVLWIMMLAGGEGEPGGEPDSQTATPPAKEASASAAHKVEIVIGGSEPSRHEMEKAIRSLLGTDSDVSWSARETFPDLLSSDPKPSGVIQIRIDVTDASRVRIVVPLHEPEGATLVRTVDAPAPGEEGREPVLRETAAQIVSATVRALQGEGTPSSPRALPPPPPSSAVAGDTVISQQAATAPPSPWRVAAFAGYSMHFIGSDFGSNWGWAAWDGGIEWQIELTRRMAGWTVGAALDVGDRDLPAFGIAAVVGDEWRRGKLGLEATAGLGLELTRRATGSSQGSYDLRPRIYGRGNATLVWHAGRTTDLMLRLALHVETDDWTYTYATALLGLRLNLP
jgi:hypothetical protein